MDLYERYFSHLPTQNARLEPSKAATPKSSWLSFLGYQEKPEMTPQLAFVTGVLYMMVSSGHITAEEMGHLFSLIGGKNQKGIVELSKEYRTLVDNATRYRNQHSLDEFIAETASKLTYAQKMCLLLNLVDSSLSDGVAAQGERDVFNRILKGYNITEEAFAPYFQVLALKADLSIFNTAEHPYNKPGYKVELDLQKKS